MGKSITLDAISAANADESIQKHAALAVTTLEELVALTPATFQPHFGKVYRDLHDLAVKASHAQASLATLEKHKNLGTYPPTIEGTIKVPKIQVSKEYAMAGECVQLQDSFTAAVNSAKAAALDKAITIKRNEHAYLVGLFSHDQVKTVASAALATVYDAACKTFSNTTDNKGKNTIPQWLSDEYGRTKTNMILWGQRAVAIGFTRHQRELVSKMAKISLRKTDDVEMTDAPGKDIQATIDLAVRRALQAAGSTSKAKKGKKGNPPGPRPAKKAQPSGTKKGNGAPKRDGRKGGSGNGNGKKKKAGKSKA